MKRVLFLCHGNICRSPMAEFIFKKRIKELNLEDKYSCTSLALSGEEIGNDIYPPAKSCLDRHNVPYDKRKARKVTNDDLTSSDVIFIMDKNNEYQISRIISCLNKVKILSGREIKDPWYTGDFETTYNQIVEGIEMFLIEEGEI